MPSQDDEGPASTSSIRNLSRLSTAGEAEGAFSVRYLPPDEQILRTIATWLHDEWGPIDDYASVEERMDSLRDHMGSRRLPLTVVAFEGETPVGAASLLRHDMDDRPRWSPWLGNVYVRRDRRGRGIAAALVTRIVDEARRLGKPELYLYTADAEGLYRKLGWQVVERRAYWSEPDVVVMRRRLVAPAVVTQRLAPRRGPVAEPALALVASGGGL